MMPMMPLDGYSHTPILARSIAPLLVVVLSSFVSFGALGQDGATQATGILEVSDVSPAPLELLVDGEGLGTQVPGRIELPAGEHDIVLHRDGYQDWTELIVIVAGTEVTLQAIQLEPIAATLGITANVAGASITIDGNLMGTTLENAEVSLEVLPGVRSLSVTLDGYSSYTTSLALEPGTWNTLNITLEQEPAPR
jgi:hypothetical protein